MSKLARHVAAQAAALAAVTAAATFIAWGTDFGTWQPIDRAMLVLVWIAAGYFAAIGVEMASEGSQP